MLMQTFFYRWYLVSFASCIGILCCHILCTVSFSFLFCCWLTFVHIGVGPRYLYCVLFEEQGDMLGQVFAMYSFSLPARVCRAHITVSPIRNLCSSSQIHAQRKVIFFISLLWGIIPRIAVGNIGSLKKKTPASFIEHENQNLFSCLFLFLFLSYCIQLSVTYCSFNKGIHP